MQHEWQASFSFEQTIRQDDCPNDADGTIATIIPTEINNRLSVSKRIMLSSVRSYTPLCSPIQALAERRKHSSDHPHVLETNSAHFHASHVSLK